MATFTRRPGPRGKKVWQVRVRRKGFPEQIRTFDTKADGQAWAGEVESRMRRGELVDYRPSTRTTVGKLLERYLEEVTPSKRGSDNEKSHARMILADPVSALSVHACTAAQLSEYRDRRLTAVSASTVNRELNLLSHVFTVAAADWGIHLPYGNPVRLIRRPKVGQDGSRDRRLPKAEEKRLLAAADGYEGEPIGAIVRLALATGMRRGEIAAMDWKHIDLKAKVATVPETKIGEARRVPLSSVAVGVLKKRPKPHTGAVWGSVHQDSISRAFTLCVKRARKQYEADCADAGKDPDAGFLADLRFHDLRHEATSRLFEKGLNPMEVASITGHKTLQMLKRYTHLRAEDLVARLG
ncbi:MAG TPA: site-specific integrase [Gammaproteobacteria bacterium]|nr:site-specific integrase [Gammaproteobacteria bacterium]